MNHLIPPKRYRGHLDDCSLLLKGQYPNWQAVVLISVPTDNKETMNGAASYLHLLSDHPNIGFMHVEI